MTKFNAITLIMTALIFTLTGEAQDPMLLRLIISAISALMLSSLYCALTEESTKTKTIVLGAAALIAATLADPDPHLIQILLAFIAAPIIAGIAIKQEIEHDHETLVEPKNPNADRETQA